MHILILPGFNSIIETLVDDSLIITLVIEKGSCLPAIKASNIIQIEKNIKFSDAEKLINEANKKLKIDKVCCFHDQYQELGFAISDRLGIDKLNSINLIKNTRCKIKMRKELDSYGISNIKYAKIANLQQLAEFFEVVSCPIILKPSRGSGSEGVLIIHNPNQAKEYFENDAFVFRDSLIAEEYIDGIEFSVEGFSEDGVHRIIAITRKFIDETSFVERGHIQPADISNAEKMKIEQYVVRILDALNFQNGPSHTEVIYSEKRGPLIVETHTRVGGDRISKLIECTTGINILELTSNQAIGKKVINEIPVKIQRISFAAIFFRFSKKKCTMKKISNLNEIRARKNVLSVIQLKQKGSKISQPTHSFDRVALVITANPNYHKTLESANLGVEDLQIDTL